MIESKDKPTNLKRIHGMPLNRGTMKLRAKYLRRATIGRIVLTKPDRRGLNF